jgi:acetyl/propionyl-CoA carboxylase alpha subunit
MITGLDIVALQLRLARGEDPAADLADIRTSGHAIECRICAENPARMFLPQPGTLAGLSFPSGVRIDTGVRQGDAVTPFYDSMIAKLIVHARTRELAIARMQRALEVMVVEGIKTTIPLHQRIMADEKFQKGDFSTKFMEDFKYEP